MKRVVAAFAVAVIAGASAGAFAHEDPNSETKAQRCDTWARNNHPGGHEHDSTSDVNLGDPLGTEIHQQSGHYVLRSAPGYAEVVGGQSYRGPDPDGNEFPGQGGYVQGEVDPVAGAPDADFNAAYFGPDADHPPAADPTAIQNWADGQYGHVCVSVANNKVEQETREP
jgi:hypothetical protein